MPGHCRFPLANPQDALSLDFVPKSNLVNCLILLCICSANKKAAHKIWLAVFLIIWIDSYNQR